MSTGTLGRYLAGRQWKRRECWNVWQLDDIPGVIRQSFSPSPQQSITNHSWHQKLAIKSKKCAAVSMKENPPTSQVIQTSVSEH